MALTIARQGGYRVLEGHARDTLAETHLALGQPAHAIDQARKALDLHRATGYPLARNAHGSYSTEPSTQPSKV
jgi:hypothetical protein